MRVTLIVGLGIAILAGIIHWAANRDVCEENLGRIGVALRQYHDHYGSYPPAFVNDREGRRMHSWRVLLLPFLGQSRLYAQYQFDEPWDGPNNSKLIARIPSTYRCPKREPGSDGITDYLAPVGATTAWPLDHCVARPQITDSIGSTVQVIEYRSSTVRWTEPSDLETKEAARLGATGALDDPHKPRRGFRTLTCDGRVRRMPFGRSSAPVVFETLFSIRGGLPLEWSMMAAEVRDEAAALTSPSSFDDTDLLPTLNGALTPGNNAIYSPALIWAWKEARRRFPMTVESDLGRTLDSQNMPRPAGSEYSESISTRGGLPHINAQFRATIAFAVQFERYPHDLDFEHVGLVESFGVALTTAPALAARLKEQVRVCYYRSPADFAVVISGREHEVLVARTDPSTTLGATLEKIEAEEARTISRKLGDGDRLLVPVLRIFAEQLYPELVELDEARQSIRFSLNESGAVIAADVDLTLNDPGIPPPQLSLVFAGPFLVAVRPRMGHAPALVAWVANRDMLLCRQH